MSQLRQNMACNDIEGLHATLSEMRAKFDKEYYKVNTVSLLGEAVENASYRLVECFLQGHVPLNSQHVITATANSSYQMLETFLGYGWDINAPINTDIPTALA